MEIINSIGKLIDYFTNQNYKLAEKFVVTFSILLILLLINNLTGFTYYYSVGKKIELIKELDESIYNNKSDSITMNFALDLKKEIIDEKNLSDRFSNFISNINLSKYGKKIQKNKLLFNLSSSGLWYLLIIIIIPLSFLNGLNTPFNEKVIGAIIMGLLLSFFAWIYYIVFSLIPIINNNWTYNYIINLLLQISSFYLFSKLSKKA